MITTILKVDTDNPDRKIIRKTAGVIIRGGLAVFPTDTVYGLGVDFNNKKAVEKLYKVKNRSINKPLIVFIQSEKELRNLGCIISENVNKLIDKFWPGALTIIFATDYGKTLGVRIPKNKVVKALLKETNLILGVSSANKSGYGSVNNVKQAQSQLNGLVDIILDGGNTDIGSESTVLDVSKGPYKILRQGAITAYEINKVVSIDT